MKTIRTLCLIALAGFAGSLAPLAAQDNVLDQARQKYDRNRTDNNADADRARDLVREQETAPAQPAQPAKPAEPADTDVRVQTEKDGVSVDVTVRVRPRDSEPAEPEEPVETAAAGHNRGFVFQFVPGIPRIGANDSAAVALSPVVSDVHAIRAIQFGTFLASTDSLNGIQLSLIGGVAGSTTGAQIAPIFAISGDTKGAQLAGIFTIAKNMDGIQGSGLFNLADSIEGFQGAGLFNIAGSGGKGVQAAGLFNIAGDFEGVQAAGLFNIAGKTKGVQVGVVNISEDLDGLAIGLINYSKNGIHEINAWYESNGALNFSILNGTKHVYTVLQGGELLSDYFKNTNSLTAGIGIGGRLGSNRGLHIQADLSARALLDLDTTVDLDTATADKLNADGWKGVKTGTVSRVTISNPVAAVFPSFRLAAGFNFGGLVGIFAGGVVDFDAPGIWSLPSCYKSEAKGTVAINGQDLTAHLKWYAGVSLL